MSREAAGAALPVLAQQGDGRFVECDAAHLVGLGVLLDAGASALHVRLAHLDRGGIEVDPIPAQRGELAAADPGHHHQPDQRAPVLVLVERRVHDPAGLLGRRRVGHRRRLTRPASGLGRVRRDPAPPDRGRQRRAEDRVDLPNRRRRQRPADVGTATVPALVRLLGDVLDERPARAPAATAPQLGVEPLQNVGLHAAERQGAERRPDVPRDVAGVAVARRLLDLGGRQPLVERVAEGGSRAGGPVGVDLGEEPGPQLLRVGRRRASCQSA